MALEPGQKLSHFRIAEKIGQGGMGMVYRAEDTRLNRPVAIKLLPPEVAGKPDRIARFEREARALAALSHPNILTLHSVEEVDGVHFLVTALVDGQSLDLVVPEGGLATEIFFKLSIQLADAVCAAHEKGITHRDLKPANIMVGRRNQLTVLDFGLARLRQECQECEASEIRTRELTMEGHLVGTVPYMSPELLQGRETDHRSDIFSLGVILYQMLAGARPFAGNTHAEIVSSILRDQAPSLSEERPGIPADLDRLILRCLEKEPGLRPASAREIRDTLESIQKQADSGAGSVSGSGIVTGTPARGLRLISGGILAAAILAAGAWIWLRPPATPEPGGAVPSSAIAVLPFSVHGGEDLGYLREGMVKLLSTKLDGAGKLRSVDPRALLGLVEQEGKESMTPEEAREIAASMGAGLFILGDVVGAGGRVQINATLYSAAAGSAALGKGTSEGTSESLFEMVDEVAAQLIGSVSEDLGSRVSGIAAVTTSSLPALKAYLEGEDRIRAGDYDAAFEALRRAVELDDTFALAYYRLSIAAEWALRSGEAFDASEKAVQYSRKLPERDRRLLEALLGRRQGKVDEAERLYRSILDTYPDDLEAWLELGELYFHQNGLFGRSFTESREAFEKVLSYDPDHSASIVHLARIDAYERRLDDLDVLIERFLEANPESDRALPALAMQAFAHGDARMIEEITGRLSRADDSALVLAMWDVSAYSWSPVGPETVARLAIDSSRSAEIRATGHSWLAHVEAAHGRIGKAREEIAALERLDRAQGLEYGTMLALLPWMNTAEEELRSRHAALEDLDPASIPTPDRPAIIYRTPDIHAMVRSYLLGLLDARLSDPEAAERHAAELPTLDSPLGAGSLQEDLALSIRSEIRRAARDTEGALALLELTQRRTLYEPMMMTYFYSQTYERFMMAELMKEHGRQEEALAWYANLADMSAVEIVYRPLCHLRQAQILEGLGRNDEAAAHYRHFIEMWSGCDQPLVPMLEEARSRLRAIGG